MNLRSITAQLIIWSLAISLLPLAAAGVLTYLIGDKQLRDELQNHLLVTADSKATQITAALRRREQDVLMLSRSPLIIDAVEPLARAMKDRGIESADYVKIDNRLRSFLNYTKETAGYEDLYLVAYNGDIAFSLNRDKDFGTNLKTGIYKDTELAKVVDRATTLLATDVSDFDYYAAKSDPAEFIAAPVFNRDVVVGAIVIQIGEEEFYSLARVESGLGQTGEVAFGARRDNNVVFLTPMRIDPQAALRRKVKMGSPLAKPMQEAVQGTNGQGLSTDYRGKQVLAVWRYIPSRRCGMVIKIDHDEASAPIARLHNRLATVAVVVALFAVAAAVWISRSIARPIVQLTLASRIIAGGDLSSRADVNATGEIGELATAFNAMINEIQQRTDDLGQLTATLEQRVADRTADLEHQTRQLEQLNNELAQSNQDLDDFAYIVSHDLKEPLRGIAGFSQLLSKEYGEQLGDDGREKLDMLIRLCGRMQQLISSLLQFSRVGHAKLAIQPTKLQDLVTEIIDSMQIQLQEEHVEVRLPKPLPTVTCDSIRIGELFRNLITNAYKYNDNDEKWIEIGCQSNEDSSRDSVHAANNPVFYVRDNGIGIREEHLDSVFRMFRRLHSRDKYGGGTGAGLAFVKKIIERHHGKIWVESVHGQGSTFYFSIGEV